MDPPAEHARVLLDMTHSARLTCSSFREDSPAANVLSADDSFWQSDASLPHWLQASWPEPVALSALHLFLNPGRDESYTPARLVVLAGDEPQHMLEVLAADVPEEFADGAQDGEPLVLDMLDANDGRPVAARVVRVVVLANYANGKDCRVHGLRLLAEPRPWRTSDPFAPF